MVIVPLLMCLFFLRLLAPGLPLNVPAAVVDLDSSEMSRSMIRSLDATELVDITTHCNSYDEAMGLIHQGKVYGFFVIPPRFESDAIAGRTPSIEYYNNLTYFIPGTLTFKGFKTIAVSTSGAIVKAVLQSVGLPNEIVDAKLQPLVIQTHPIGNPWTSYAVYLSPSFTFGTLALLIFLMTVLSITGEIKRKSSVQWLASAQGNMLVAVSAKLLPHFIIWSIVSQACLSFMFCYSSLPCSNLPAMMLAMELFIIACQALGLFFCCVFPNPRLAFSMASLFGILSFSFTGFSFPVQEMYGAIAIFSYLAPVRHLFLIYATLGLNDFAIYYTRWYFLALLLFPILGVILLGRLRRVCLNPVYVP